METLAGKVVVVTGASSGIGREAARRAAAQGAHVVLAARVAAPLREVEAELGADALVQPTDVRDEAAVEALAAAAVERFGRLDVWVNCAGVMAYGRFHDVPSDVFRAVIETNLMGQVHGARAALTRFRAQGEGSLVNVGSLWSRVTTPDVSAYITSKFAVRGFTEVLQQELRREPGIGVSLVVPQAVDTPIFDRSGNYSGRRPRPIGPMVGAGTVADAILACALRPRRIATRRVLAQALALLHDLVPPLYHRTMPTAFETGNYGPGSEAPDPKHVLQARPGEYAVSAAHTAIRTA
jgi:NAD(P)-dependent dehydrogenase (short-subunit alcohol dehydrogenase family)